MEIPSNTLERIVFNTRPKTKEAMFLFMDKSTHEQNLSQSLQIKKIQIKIAVSFLTG